ncbi:MAG: TrkA family potassium uptake protein [Acholeplasmataceae bacterium]|nr:MAG: TrkA family potassium uptake protein [Acholeplasmataceae bacterium]
MKRNKFIVIGSGRLGSSIATKMSEMGEDVLIIDANDDAFRKLQESFSGYEVIGDATDLGTLERANIKHARTVVVTTDSDNINLFIAHVCFYIYNVPRIYVRLNDTDKGQLLEGTDIQPIFPFNLSINAFLSMYNGGDNA